MGPGRWDTPHRDGRTEAVGARYGPRHGSAGTQGSVIVPETVVVTTWRPWPSSHSSLLVQE